MDSKRIKKIKFIVCIIILSITWYCSNSITESNQQQISHFSNMTIVSEEPFELVYLFGQYKSDFGFFVGEEIEITAILTLDDEGKSMVENLIEMGTPYPFFSNCRNIFSMNIAGNPHNAATATFAKSPFTYCPPFYQGI